MLDYKDKDWLYHHYIEEDMTTKQIAQICYVKKGTIKGLLHKHRIIKRGPVTYSEVEGSVRYLYSKYKSRAKKSNLEFSITIEEFSSLIKRDCIYCGAKPQNECKKRYKDANDIEYNGVDRINNNKGYTSDNSAPCCAQCNKSKSNLDISKWFTWLENTYNMLFPIVEKKRKDNVCSL